MILTILRKFILCAIAVVVLVQSASAQSSFVPKSVGTSVNSVYDETHPVISADRKTLFFTRTNHPANHRTTKGSASIWCSEWKSNEWSAPVLLTSPNKGKSNIVLSITEDGKQLLVSNDNTLGISERQNNEWTVPQRLEIKATRDASLSPDGNYLLFAKAGKLFFSVKKAGRWESPVEIKGLPKGIMSNPYLSGDNKTLYFTRNLKDHGSDIFRTQRIGEEWSTWTSPTPLNEMINTPSMERELRTNVNGAWGYYTSAKNSSAQTDIYQVKLYEDQPYVIVRGEVVNSVSKRPLRNKDVIILVDGRKASTYEVNKDSGTYKVKLPLGSTYTVSAFVDHYSPVACYVDFSSEKEFKTVSMNLPQVPLPYVLLKGKMLVKNTGKAIPRAAKPSILIDGEEVDSAFVDASAGTYSIKLKHGTSYYIQVTAKRFESLPEVLDLSRIDGYEEISVDLQADAEKMAIVRGKIIDKKTGKPIEDISMARLVVEGVSSVVVNLDQDSAQYELRVPLREKHIISAYIPGYCSVYEAIDVSNETKEVQVNRDLNVVPFEPGQSVRLNNIFFEAGKTSLTEASYPELDRLIAFLTVNPSSRIEIGAHTDKTSKISTLNMAKEVATYLTNKGIAKNRITVRGYASTKPVASNATPEGRALNRRVEFTIVEK